METLKANILLVEDEQEIRELMALHLLRQGFQVQECASSEEAVNKIRSGNFQLVILDWMLPGVSGVEFISNLKNLDYHPSVLMVTAKSDPSDIVHGLESGADDFLTKPFDPMVFLARVRALLRRKQEVINKQSKLQLKGLSLDLQTYEVFLEGLKLHFTPSEYKLLVSMMENRGKVLTRDQLIESVQGEGVNVTGRTVDTHVFALRKKLANWGENVETIRGVGYRIRTD